MKYLDLLNRFWRLHRERRFCQLDICLYMYILDEFNRARWPQSLPIPTSRISQSLSESAHSIIRSRSRLTERGLIGYTPGRSASAAAVYFFDGVYSDRLGCPVTDPSGNADSEAAASMDREQDSVLVGNASASRPISGVSEDGEAVQRTVTALVGGTYSDSAIGADSNADACSDTAHLYKIKDNKKKDNNLVVVNNAHARVPECEDYMERFFAEENSARLEQFVMMLHRENAATSSIEHVRAFAEEAVCEWALQQRRHDSYPEWSAHLTNIIRVKNAKAKRNNGNSTTGAGNSAYQRIKAAQNPGYGLMGRRKKVAS